MEYKEEMINGVHCVVTENGSFSVIKSAHEIPKDSAFPDGANCAETGSYEALSKSTGYIILESLLDSRTYLARKTGYVLVTDMPVGAKFKVYTSNGNLEAEETVSEDCVVLTKCNAKGEPIYDAHGHVNQWQITREMLEKKYDYDVASHGGVIRPRGGIQTFIQLDFDFAVMKPWGEKGALIPECVKKSGYLNITDPDDIYGIAEEEFIETYEIRETISS